MLEDDFPPEVRERLGLPEDIVRRLQNELERFGGDCHYDSDLRRIIYHNLELAERAYDARQLSEIEDYIQEGVEETPSRDDENRVAFEWINQHREGFRELWMKTHAYIPANSAVGRVA